MKITKSMMQENTSEIRRLQANRGCNVCPCCGENKPMWEYMDWDTLGSRGILGGAYRSYCKGIFRLKNMRVDCYKCYTCGAEWESEPYEW